MNHVRDASLNTFVMQQGDAIDPMEHVGARLRFARKLSGLSQKELAQRAGVAQSTIANIESGARDKPREIVAICGALNVNAEWLMTGKGPGPGDSHQPQRQQQPVLLRSALPVVLSAFADLTPGQWRMVRARLDDLPGEPATVTDVLSDVAKLLQDSQPLLK